MHYGYKGLTAYDALSRVVDVTEGTGRVIQSVVESGKTLIDQYMGNTEIASPPVMPPSIVLEVRYGMVILPQYFLNYVLFTIDLILFSFDLAGL